MAKNTQFVLEVLQENGMVTEEQINEAWEKVAQSGGKLEVIDALKELKYVDGNELLNLLAQQYGLEVVDLSNHVIDPDVVQTMTPETVRQYKVIPISKHEGTIVIATSDPSDIETIDAIRYILKKDVEAVVAPAEQISQMIDHYYGSLEQNVDAFMREIGADGEDIEAQLAKATEGAGNVEDDAPIIKLVSLIIVEAIKMKASDIHLEPMEKKYRVRYRIDGVLQEMESPPKYLQANITSRLKIMAKLDISEKRVPQDGRIQLKVEGKDIDLRVSTIPTTHGESIVMRILDRASIQLDIPKLGFFSDDQELVNKIINLPDGIFLVTGPTGSGKSTSLYAFLNSINSPHRKIITVEDPVEYQLSGINQVQVVAQIGMTFAKALRAMLRQAPNIVMVGEIRDLETAEIAINAALTGHLVFSTLHTNDAPGAVTRLIDMGIKPFLVASSVRAVMAQRLVRRICKNCAVPAEPDPELLQVMGLDEEFVKNSKLMKGRGCAECGGKGYKGRMGIYEIFMVTTEIQNLIYERVPSSVIKEAARKAGMRTLREDGVRKAAAGMTTLEEVLAMTVLDEE